MRMSQKYKSNQYGSVEEGNVSEFLEQCYCDCLDCQDGLKKQKQATTKVKQEVDDNGIEFIGGIVSPNASLDTKVISDNQVNLVVKTNGISCRENECHKLYFNNHDLNQHLLKDHRIQPFSCMALGCLNNFDKIHGLTQHILKSHQATVWQCNFNCWQMFTNYSELYQHIIRYHQKGRFKCPSRECDFTSNTSRDEVYQHLILKHSSELFDIINNKLFNQQQVQNPKSINSQTNHLTNIPHSSPVKPPSTSSKSHYETHNKTIKKTLKSKKNSRLKVSKSKSKHIIKKSIIPNQNLSIACVSQRASARKAEDLIRDQNRMLEEYKRSRRIESKQSKYSKHSNDETRNNIELFEKSSNVNTEKNISLNDDDDDSDEIIFLGKSDIDAKSITQTYRNCDLDLVNAPIAVDKAINLVNHKRSSITLQSQHQQTSLTSLGGRTNINGTTNVDRPYKCDICGNDFRYADSVQMHKMNFHSDNLRK